MPKKPYCHQLTGRKILAVRELTKKEMDLYGWYPGGGTPAVVLILDGELAVVPSRDPEGNAPGFLFVEKH